MIKKKKSLHKIMLPTTNLKYLVLIIVAMAYLSGLVALSALAIKTMIPSLTTQVENTVLVEIPAFDPQAQKVISQQEIKKRAEKLLSYLQTHRDIQNVDVPLVDIGYLGDDYDRSLPLPIFIQLALRSDISTSQILELKDFIQKIDMNVFVKTPQSWDQNINQQLFNAVLLLSLLCIIIALVTIATLSGTLKAQLQGSTETIALFHLLGSDHKAIKSLFYKAVLRCVIPSCLFGLFIAFLTWFTCIPKTTILLSFSDIALYFGAIIMGFIFITRVIAYFAIKQAIKGYP